VMDDKDLLSILRQEEADASSYHDSELASAQQDSLERFNAAPYGDEVDHRSKVVTHDVEDAVNWIMPDLMQWIMQTDDLVTLMDDSHEDERKKQDVADYLFHVLMNDNDGEMLVHDWIWDGLVCKAGILYCQWKDPEDLPPQEVEGAYAEQIQGLQEAGSEVLEAEEAEDGTFNIKIGRKTDGYALIEGVAPEEFRITRRAKSIKDADYRAWVQTKRLSDVIELHPKFADELRSSNAALSGTSGFDVESDGRLDARFPDESTALDDGLTGQDDRKEVDYFREEIKIDFDGDGIAELRSITRVGNVILENEEIERTGFVGWSPIRVAHRAIGRSIADTLVDLQKVKTVVLRRALDSLSQSLMPRHVVNRQKVKEGGVDALLDAEVGDVIEVDGDVGQAIMPLVTPDLTGSAYQMLEYTDQRKEEASGISRQAQGLRDEAITDTADGIARLQGSANKRVAFVARWVAKGLEELLETILHLTVAHQNGARTVRIGKRQVVFDSTSLDDTRNISVSVHVGQVGEHRATRLNNLSGIAAKQEQVIAQAGAENPICGVAELRNTYAMMVHTMGMRDATGFFKEIPDDYEPPQQDQQPDPKVIEAQEKAKLAEQEQQFNQQAKQAELQLKQQFEQMKLESEAQIAAMRMEMEERIAGQRMVMEERLAVMKIGTEASIEGGNGLSSNRPGGSLYE
jgi:hypothetical protein